MSQEKAMYRNPWHDARLGEYGPAFYTTFEKPREYRGCLIYHRTPLVFDVVKDGVCLTQCAGLNGAKKAIDKMLDDPEDFFSQRMLSYLPLQAGV